MYRAITLSPWHYNYPFQSIIHQFIKYHFPLVDLLNDRMSKEMIDILFPFIDSFIQPADIVQGDETAEFLKGRIKSRSRLK